MVFVGTSLGVEWGHPKDAPELYLQQQGRDVYSVDSESLPVSEGDPVCRTGTSPLDPSGYPVYGKVRENP